MADGAEHAGWGAVDLGSPGNGRIGGGVRFEFMGQMRFGLVTFAIPSSGTRDLM